MTDLEELKRLILTDSNGREMRISSDLITEERRHDFENDHTHFTVTSQDNRRFSVVVIINEINREPQ